MSKERIKEATTNKALALVDLLSYYKQLVFTLFLHFGGSAKLMSEF